MTEPEARGARLWAAMVEQGLGYSELAQRSGVSARTVMRVRYAQTPRPRLSTITKLAEALDVEPG
jgi:transcriptional regulator with XRE-family HTH domain